MALVVAMSPGVAFAVLNVTGHATSQSSEPGGGVRVNDRFSNVTNRLSS